MGNIRPKLNPIFLFIIHSQVWIKTSFASRQVWTKFGSHWIDVNKIQSLLEGTDQIWLLHLVTWQLKLDYLGLVVNKVCFFLLFFFFFSLIFSLPSIFFVLKYIFAFSSSPPLYFNLHIFPFFTCPFFFFPCWHSPINFFLHPFFSLVFFLFLLLFFSHFRWYVIGIYTKGSNIICMEFIFLHYPSPLNFFYSTSFSLLCLFYLLLVFNYLFRVFILRLKRGCDTFSTYKKLVYALKNHSNFLTSFQVRKTWKIKSWFICLTCEDTIIFYL